MSADAGSGSPALSRRHTGSEQQRDQLASALGGRRGLLDSGLPGIVFVAVYTLASLTPAVWAAVAIGAVLTVIRVVRKETLQHALAGFVGVALAAFIAQRTGRAENFFLPGLFINAGYAVAYLVSILVRWPLIGVVVGPLIGEGTAWRQDPARLRAYTLASWVWVVMFLVRLAVQLPLYLASALVALGIAKLALGWPLFLATAWVCYLILRRVPPTVPSTGSPHSTSPGAVSAGAVSPGAASSDALSPDAVSPGDEQDRPGAPAA